MKRSLFVAVLASGVIVAAVASLAMAARMRSSVTVVNVVGKEFSFVLSRKSGQRGTFVFRFTNRGLIRHDFKIAGKKTPLLQSGKSATLRVTITKAGRYPYVCTVPGHAVAGMKGVFAVR